MTAAHVSSRLPATKREPLVELDTQLVAEAIERNRRLAAKRARAELQVRAHEHRLAQLEAERARLTMARARWRRGCLITGGLLAITWGTAAVLELGRLASAL